MLSRFRKKQSNKDDGTEATSPLKAMKMPNKDSMLEDKIAEARNASGPFQYISVTGYAKETKKKRLDRLISSRPILKTEEMEMSELPIVDLILRNEKFSLSEILGPRTLKSCKKYIQLEEVRVQFASTQGFYDSYSEVIIGIWDGRMADNKMVRSSTVETNKPSLTMFSLDYCIHKNDISDLFLSVECSNSPLLPGKVWGSMQIQLKLQFSDAARPVMLESTLAVIELPQSAMMKMKTNPYHANLAMDNDDMDEVRKFYKQGRITDRSKPAEKQNLMAFSGSVAGSDDDVGEGPSNIPGMQRYLQSMVQERPAIPEEDIEVFSETGSEKAMREQTEANSARNKAGSTLPRETPATSSHASDPVAPTMKSSLKGKQPEGRRPFAFGVPSSPESPTAQVLSDLDDAEAGQTPTPQSTPVIIKAARFASS